MVLADRPNVTPKTELWAHEFTVTWWSCPLFLMRYLLLPWLENACAHYYCIPSCTSAVTSYIECSSSFLKRTNWRVGECVVFIFIFYHLLILLWSLFVCLLLFFCMQIHIFAKKKKKSKVHVSMPSGSVSI